MGTNKRTFPFKGDITNSKKMKMITPILLVGLAALLSPVSAMPNTEEYKAKGPLPYGINYQHHLEEAQPRSLDDLVECPLPANKAGQKILSVCTHGTKCCSGTC